MSTIFAPLCGPSSGSVQIIRVSGSKSKDILSKIIESKDDLFLNPRKLFLKDVINKDTNEVIDKTLITFFESPNSYTGEDSIEINIHASTVIERELYDLLIKHGARAAEPGEFTKRAFLNGQMDLIQAEAVADLINSKTKEQARLAKQQLSGRLSSLVDSVAEPLRDFLAIIEAHIDFPEEGIEEQTFSQWKEVISPISKKLKSLLATYSSGRMTKEGAQVVLCGIPNAGKSSLLNALAKEDRAIVTEIAGTTTDSIEQLISLNGFVVSLWDTAGLEENREVEKIEKLGIEKSWERIKQSDLVLFVLDLTQALDSQLTLLEKVKSTSDVLVLINKSDIIENVSKQLPDNFLDKYILTSAKEDLTSLENEIIKTPVSYTHLTLPTICSV